MLLNLLVLRCADIQLSKAFYENLGLSFDKEKQKFLAQVNRGNIRGYVGRYKTIEEAFQSHKIKKEQYIKEVADKYKKEITEATYQAMYNYQVEITD